MIYYVKDKHNENVCFRRWGRFYQIAMRRETMCREVLPLLTLLVNE